jgi:hypothetical protein
MSTVSLMTLKAEALRASGTLHPEPGRVIDPLFQGLPFFDGRDLVQVKYEMLRRVTREHASVQVAATAFGFSRVTWYQVKGQYDTRGLVGLLPRWRGPKPDPKKLAATSNRFGWLS